MNVIERIVRRGILMPILAALTACSSVAPTRSGFLSDYASLAPEAGDESVLVSTPLAAAWTPSASVTIAPVVVMPGAAEHDPASARELGASFELYLRERLAAVMPVVEHAGPSTLTVRGAVTAIEASSPWLNVPTLLLLGLPIDNGGAVAELEVLGPDGRVLHREVSSGTGNVFAFWHAFGTQGFTRQGLDTIAERLAVRLASSRGQR
jgi:hypothetical protein